MNELTKDADKMLCVLYKEYMQRRSNSVPKRDSKFFGDANFIKVTLFNEMSVSDISETARELSKANYVEADFADDELDYLILTDDCIVRMESRFKNGFLEVVDFISKFIP